MPHIPPKDNFRLLGALHKGFGEGKLEYIQLTNLSYREKRAFLEALKTALEEIEARGAESFAEPSFYPGYIDRFRELIDMIFINLSEWSHDKDRARTNEES